jgi:hypothetical protein
MPSAFLGAPLQGFIKSVWLGMLPSALQWNDELDLSGLASQMKD